MNTPFSRLVVAYDGSPPANAALDFALATAERYDGSVVVANVSETLVPAVLSLDGEHAGLAAAQAALLASLDPLRRQLVNDVSTHLGARRVPVSMELATNTVPAGILDAANRWNADAIVIGTHGRSGLARVVIGSTAESIARRADIPVVIVRDGSASRGGGLRRVIVGIPSTRENDQPLRLAIALARDCAARVVLVAVADIRLIHDRAVTYGYDPEPLFRELRAAANDALEKAMQEAQDAGVAPDTSIVEEGDITAGLLRAADLHDADAVLIGTHDQGVLSRFFYENVGEATARRSTVPVIIVPKVSRIATRVAPHVTASP